MSPVVIMANRFQFDAGQQIHHGPVFSYMQLWCEAGHGQLWCNGEHFSFSPGQVVLLPWGRQIRYRADEQEPFRLAGIHLLPHADAHDYARYFHKVPHQGEGGPLDAQTGHGPVIEQLCLRHWDASSAWSLCSAAIVASHLGASGPEDVCQQQQEYFAHLLVNFWQQAQSSKAEPSWLSRVRQLIQEANYSRVGVQDLVRWTGKSASQLERHIRQHCGQTPMQLVASVRMQQAREILSESSMPIQEIADQLGFSDAFHFSKRFKAASGMSPRAWRQTHQVW